MFSVDLASSATVVTAEAAYLPTLMYLSLLDWLADIGAQRLLVLSN